MLFIQCVVIELEVGAHGEVPSETLGVRNEHGIFRIGECIICFRGIARPGLDTGDGKTKPAEGKGTAAGAQHSADKVLLASKVELVDGKHHHRFVQAREPCRVPVQR